mmetsp:Transcript_16015/g.39224  ORF Transcript_16015/g.39224 Transcript_16015/m.39224 type:complete len:131 (-) Transcript_16015:153-545(-)
MLVLLLLEVLYDLLGSDGFGDDNGGAGESMIVWVSQKLASCSQKFVASAAASAMVVDSLACSTFLLLFLFDFLLLFDFLDDTDLEDDDLDLRKDLREGEDWMGVVAGEVMSKVDHESDKGTVSSSLSSSP